MAIFLTLFWFAFTAATPAFGAQPLRVTFHAYTISADFTQPGSIFEGAVLTKRGDGLTYGTSIGTLNYTDPFGYGTHTYSYDRWTSGRYRCNSLSASPAQSQS